MKNNNKYRYIIESDKNGSTDIKMTFEYDGKTIDVMSLVEKYLEENKSKDKMCKNVFVGSNNTESKSVPITNYNNSIIEGDTVEEVLEKILNMTSNNKKVIENKAPNDVERFKNGDFVKHFKGGIYKIISINGKIADNGADYKKVVIYKAIKPIFDGSIYVRDYNEFASEVDREKYPGVNQKYRFSVITSQQDLDYLRRIENRININKERPVPEVGDIVRRFDGLHYLVYKKTPTHVYMSMINCANRQEKISILDFQSTVTTDKNAFEPTWTPVYELIARGVYNDC